MGKYLEKIVINGKELTLLRRVWDDYNECHWYYTKERDEPFCDLCDDIEGEQSYGK